MSTIKENMTNIVQHRRGTTEEWNNSLIIPYEGELVIEECADGTRKVKIGDGKQFFNQLSYVDAESKAAIEALRSQITKNSSDISETNKAVSNLRKEVDSVSSAFQSFVDPSIEKLEAKYSAKLADIEAQHLEDRETLEASLTETKTELLGEITDKLSAHATTATDNLETKTETLKANLFNQLKESESDLKKQLDSLKAAQENTDSSLDTLGKKVSATDISLDSSLKRIGAGELKIADLETELNNLKNLGYVDFVTAEMLGQLRAVEAKVEQLSNSDITVLKNLYAAQASVNKLIRQLKDVQDKHKSDFDTLDTSFKTLKIDLQEADSKLLRDITAELTQLWKEIHDLVDDDVLLHTHIVNTRNALNAKLATLEADVKTETASLKSELTQTFAEKEAAINNSIKSTTDALNSKLDSAKSELLENIETAKSTYETNKTSTNQAIRAVVTDVNDKHTEVTGRIDTVIDDIGKHKLDVTNSFSSVNSELNNINRKTTELESRLTVERARVDSQAKQFNQFIRLKDGSTTGDAELVNARVDFTGKEYNSVGDYLRVVDGNIRQHIKTDAIAGLHYDTEGKEGLQEPYMLYLKNANGEILQDTGVQIISGAGGGAAGGGSAILKIEYITTSPVIVTQSDTAVLYFRFSGEDSSGDRILQANAVWKINGETREYGVVNDGENSFDVTKYLKVGTTKVLLTVTDDSGRVVTKSWSVQQINLSVESDFDDKSYITINNKATFTYTPVGAIDKTAVFILDNEEIARVNLPSGVSGTKQEYPIPAQSHGAHLLEVYLEAEINGRTVYSDSVVKDLLWYDSSSELPIIGTAIQEFSTKQYSTTKIVYTVYDPTTAIPEVDIEIDGEVVSIDTLSPNKDYNNTPTAVYSYVTDIVGSHTIKIRCRDVVEKVITVTVNNLGINADPVTAGLVFDFNPVGRNNGSANRLWSYDNGEEVVSLNVSNNFDWTNGGYLPNDPDGPCFCIKAGSSATIDYKLFADDAKKNGKEFKLIFKTKNVANPEAVFLSCLDGTTDTNRIGLKMGVHNANIYGQSGNLELTYSEEDIIEFEFNISKKTEKVPMVMGYEDGVPSRPMVYDDSYSFTQSNKQIITLGSSDCDLYIYRFKVYNTSLSSAEILKNFIADARTADEMRSRYNRNQIYDENAQLNPDVLAEKCPWLRVYKISAPHFTNNKSDKVPNTTITQIYKNGDPVLDNWTCYNAQHSGQGTSSNNYGAAGRNLDFIMNKSGVPGITPYFILGDDTEASEITLTRTSVPVAYLNAKVNIASSNNLTNAMLANHYNSFNPYRRPFVRPEGYPIDHIKDTMEFHNCVIFIQETDPDLSTHREFADTDYHFYAIGNIGDSKKTDDTRVTDPGDKYECCVEIMDVGLSLSDFPTDTMINAMSYTKDTITGENIYTWAKTENLSKLYEIDGNFVKTSDTEVDHRKCYYKVNGSNYSPVAYVTKADLKNLYELDGEYKLTSDTDVDFEKTYYIDILENDDFSEDYTYGWRYISDDEDEDVVSTCKQAWIDFYRFVTTAPDEEFKARLSEYFVVDSALYYYLFTTRYCMVDNRAKNTFWHYSKTADGTRKWDLCWDYDNDTSLGLNNYGKQVYRYGLEDIDKDNAGKEIFRESDSVFFCRVRDLFANELKAMYKDLESKNAWLAESFLERCDEWQNEFPEELWRIDIERKYLRTYTSSFIDGTGDPQFLVNMCNGRMKYHRRQWERSQEQYMASKYQTIRSSSDKYHANFRVNRFDDTSSLVVSPNYQFTLTPFSYIYLNVWYGDTSRTPYSVRAVPNVPTPVPCPPALDADIINIGNASAIRDFGDLSACYPNTVSIGNASRVKTLTLGSNTEGYNNETFTTLITDANPLLEELNVENITGLNQSLDLRKLINLKKVYALGTNIPSILFANGGKMEHAELPAVNNITLKNLLNLSTTNDKFKLSDYSNVKILSVEGCPLIDKADLFDKCTNLSHVRLIGVDFGNRDYNIFSSKAFKLKGLNANNEETDNAWLVGKIHFTDECLTGENYNNISLCYPELEISYEKLESQLKFMKADMVTVYEEEGVNQIILNGGNGVNPVPDYISAPELPSTPEFDYEWFGWSTTPGVIVNYESLNLSEAEAAEDTDRNKYNEEILTNVEGDRTLYPVFKAIRRKYTVTFINLTTTEGDYYYSCQALNVPYGSTATCPWPTKEILKHDVEDKSAYVFNGWENNADENITGDTVCYATFAFTKVATLSLVDISSDDLLNRFGNSLGKKGYTLDSMNHTMQIIACKPPLDPSITIPSTLSVEGIEYTITSVGGFYYVNPTYNHARLAHIKLADTVETIDQYAFKGCTNLSNVELSNTLREIKTHSFEGCISLKSITLPSSLTEIVAGAFVGCTKLSNIDTNSNTYFNIIDNCLVSNDTVLFGIFSTDTKVPEDSSITHLASESFTGNTQLTGELVIPINITSIDSSAFKFCTSLISLDIKNADATLDSSCFSGCTSLSTVTLPSNLTEIPTYAFNGCALRSIEIPASISDILDHAFGNIKTNSFEVNFSKNTNLTDLFIHEQAFQDCAKVIFNLPCSEEDWTDYFGDSKFGATEAVFNFTGGNN